MLVNLHVRVSLQPVPPDSPSSSQLSTMEERVIKRVPSENSDPPQVKRPKIIQMRQEQLQQYPLFLSLLSDQSKPTVAPTSAPSNCILPQATKVNYQTIKNDALPILPVDAYEDMFQEVVRKFYGENVVAIETANEPGSSGLMSNDLNIILSDYGKDVLDGQNLVSHPQDETQSGLGELAVNGADNGEPGDKKKKLKRSKSNGPTTRLYEWMESEEVLTWTTSKIASYSAVHKIFRCVDCGCVGFLARIAEHWLGTHANIKVFECPRCPYVSAWARCIRMHISRMHTDQASDTPIWRENRVLADVTKYLLALKNKLDLLEENGKEEKKYSCQFCQYSTDRRDLYTRHESIHSNEKPFECFVCLKEFNRADHCKKHFLRMHKDVEYDVHRIRKNTNIGQKDDRMETPMDTSSQSAPSAEPPPDPSPLPKEASPMPVIQQDHSIYLSELDTSFENKGQQLILRKCFVNEVGSDLQVDGPGRILRDVPLSHIIRDTRESARETIQPVIRENAHLQQVIRENVHVVRESAPRENVYIMRDNPHLVMRDSRDTNILAIVRDTGIVKSGGHVLLREANVRDVLRESEEKPRVRNTINLAQVNNQQLMEIDPIEIPLQKTDVLRTLPPIREIREQQFVRSEPRELPTLRELPELLNFQPQQQNPLQLLQAPLQVITSTSSNSSSTNQLYQLVTFASLQGSGVVNFAAQPQATAIAVQPKTQPGATIHYSPVTFPTTTFSSPIKESQMKSVVETLVRTTSSVQQTTQQALPSPPVLSQAPIQKPPEDPPQQSIQVAQASTTTETSPSKSKKKSREKLYSCTFCSWKGVDNWCLKRHLNTHIRPFLCVLCDYKAARSERLSTHMQKVHNKRICTRCSFITNDQESLSLHMKENH